MVSFGPVWENPSITLLRIFLAVLVLELVYPPPPEKGGLHPPPGQMLRCRSGTFRVVRYRSGSFWVSGVVQGRSVRLVQGRSCGIVSDR